MKNALITGITGQDGSYLAELLLDKKIPVLTGQFKVSPDDVMLKPALLEARHQNRKEANSNE